QEELAEKLYVSRTAISKWESGRGYPGIESLKAIAKFFSVSIDELLSGEEMLTLAQAEQQNKTKSFRDLIFGLLDCSFALLYALPFFGQVQADSVQAVSLLSLTTVQPYLKVLYLLAITFVVLFGVLTLAMQKFEQEKWQAVKSKISFGFNSVCILLFILGRQPYAAAYCFVFLLIKMGMLVKKV
ncbi:MAG: helix-turn-helix transcriptional regulator, partial [Clostridia bacterium]|nr:helix-turn-helix transcriptional regulator [Clostridia bacterium]